MVKGKRTLLDSEGVAPYFFSPNYLVAAKFGHTIYNDL